MAPPCFRLAPMSRIQGMRSADYWHTRAAEARAKADQMHDRDARNTMLGIATATS